MHPTQRQIGPQLVGAIDKYKKLLEVGTKWTYSAKPGFYSHRGVLKKGRKKKKKVVFGGQF